MITPGLFSSLRGDYETPQALYDALDREFDFSLDACAIEQNAKCASFYSPEHDGLAQEWRGAVWCNPPYGRKIGAWIRKAYESARNGATVVLLIPSRTDTAWWHDWIMQADEIRFVRGRLKFGDAKGRAPFPSAIVVFRGMK